jgi:hypothetical protein
MQANDDFGEHLKLGLISGWEAKYLILDAEYKRVR